MENKLSLKSVGMLILFYKSLRLKAISCILLICITHEVLEDGSGQPAPIVSPAVSTVAPPVLLPASFVIIPPPKPPPDTLTQLDDGTSTPKSLLCFAPLCASLRKFVLVPFLLS